jgi:hypothetical protein
MVLLVRERFNNHQFHFAKAMNDRVTSADRGVAASLILKIREGQSQPQSMR